MLSLRTREEMMIKGEWRCRMQELRYQVAQSNEKERAGGQNRQEKFMGGTMRGLFQGERRWSLST